MLMSDQFEGMNSTGFGGLDFRPDPGSCAVLTQRGEQAALQQALDKLAALHTAVQAVDHAEYETMKSAALARIGPRDPDDWPVLACALALNCPIWTEDKDFFGTGVATWTTALIELFLTETDSGPAEH